MISEFITAFITTFAGYFVIVDPIGVSLIFHGMTDGGERAYARSMAIKSVTVSLTMVALFALFGKLFLESLGIGVDAIRIAGGILLFHTAFGMITRPDTKTAPAVYQEEPKDISVYPLSIPLMAGPGVLTFTVLEFSKNSGSPTRLIASTSAIILVYAVTATLLIISARVLRITGRTVNAVFKRLLGILLASLAIQFILDGVNGAFFSG